MLYYLAYGSNLHPFRLTKRCPSARVIGVIPLPGYRVTFHKISKDGSGKCNLYKEPGVVSYGVLYELEDRDKLNLDKAEGLGYGYLIEQFSVPLNGENYNAFSYIADPNHISGEISPYHWYKNLVLAGARHHQLPNDYVAALEAVKSSPDPDAKREQENAELLRQMGFA